MTPPSFWQAKFDLSRRNTMAIPSTAEWYAEVTDESQLQITVAQAKHHNLPLTILGGGSNVLCADAIGGVIIHPANTGISVNESDSDVLLTIAAGENWHQLTEWTLDRHFFGLENLALIPGNVGAAPIQNIGAYGVELSDALQSVCWFDFAQQTFVDMSAEDCQLGYRDSIFKGELKGRGLIWSVTLKLSKQPNPVVSYGPLQQRFENFQASPREVFEAVCQLRQANLPDPNVVPNAGSFFKNPVIDVASFEKLQQNHPEVPYFSAGEKIKVPAAWLIDHAGLKGKTVAGLVVHARQALVLTNPMRLGLVDVLKARDAIAEAVFNRFDIVLEAEPQLLF